MKKIIGLGSGRCGTESLSKFLDMQKDTRCTHQSKYRWLPYGYDLNYSFNTDQFNRMIKFLDSSNTLIVGDTAAAYINYVESLISTRNDYFFVVLQRERIKTIESIYSYLEVLQFISSKIRPHLDDWSNLKNLIDESISAEELYRKLFSNTQKSVALYSFNSLTNAHRHILEKYTNCSLFGMTAKEFIINFISCYYDDYYKKCEELEQKYPTRFKIFQTEDLNSLEGQKSILSFLGYREEDMILVEGGIREGIMLSL